MGVRCRLMLGLKTIGRRIDAILTEYAGAVAGNGGWLQVGADASDAEVAVDASAGFLACRDLYTKERRMIRESDWQNLEQVNREMALRLERVRKVRATGDKQGIRQAEMAYLQALQCVYDAAVSAVSDYARLAGDE